MPFIATTQQERGIVQKKRKVNFSSDYIRPLGVATT